MRSLAADALPILVVDDDNALIRTLADILRLHGYAPRTAETGAQGLDLVAKMATPPALALVDLRLPDMDGLEVVARLRGISDLTQVVVLTGHASLDSAVAAMREQSLDYLIKPVAVDQLLKTVEIAGERWQRRQVEEALRRSEAEYRGLVEQAPLGIYRSTPDGRFLSANPALVAMLGYDAGEEVLRLNLPRDVYQDAGDRVRLMSQGSTRPVTVETEWKRKDGRRISVRLHVRPARGASGAVEYFDALVEDVTEQRNLERQFLQAQKMEAVGRLAGGVAHDFNNLLTVVLSTCDLLTQEMEAGDPMLQDVQDIRVAGERAAELTRQLLTFSRRGVVAPSVIDLREVMGNLDKMLRRLIGEDIELRTVARSPVGLVRADIGQIEQVVVNLAVNARDAMPRGGNLTIEIADHDLAEAVDTDRREIPEGRYVLLAVSDTGTGMNAETRARLFEPFFTTKEQGKGTGLGLATVYGIVKQSNGHVWVYSEPGAGTTFKILLPRVEEAAVARTSAPAPQVLEGSETVLLVEDNDQVLVVAQRALETYGYRVLVARTSAEAAERMRQASPAVQLLVTDVVMPGTSGRALAAELEAAHPGLKVLFVSGYTDDAVVRHGVLQQGVNYLQKPFTGAALVRKVREVLDA